ncbi:MAG: prolyl oligopeptidase family serine peptidase [Bacteroidota bacterium]|nr:prolyl oligopeptidase family serine peptidase [Bacteroidota bacterium]
MKKVFYCVLIMLIGLPVALSAAPRKAKHKVKHVVHRRNSHKSYAKRLAHLGAAYKVPANLASKAIVKPAVKSEGIHYPYLTYVPDSYKADKNKSLPLIIYLHGRSASGNNLSSVRRYGIPFYMDRGMQCEAVVVAPQCPWSCNWSSQNWFGPLIKEITQKYHIDTTRIYLTGMSMGGFGAWDLAIKHPDLFAAVLPLCGGGVPKQVGALKDMPVWAFHGDRDRAVPIKRTEEMVDALKAKGGKPKFTILHGAGHDIHRTFGDKRIYDWMFKHFKRKPSSLANLETAETDTTDWNNFKTPY